MLGVAREAPELEIRRAYRRLARRYSPDVNLLDERAQDLFEEIAEAYRVLGNPAARAVYDRLGHRAFDPDPPGGSALQGRGDDVHYALDLDLEEALRGVDAVISVTRLEPCAACGGKGGAGGQALARCPACDGRPVRLSLDGIRAMTARCPDCGGAGWQVPAPCRRCGGRGTVSEARRISIAIPPGVDTGAQVRFPAEGHAAPAGGRRGDLIVIARVRPHPLYARKGDHLACEVPVTIPEAALGARIQVPTPDGPAVLTIPAGTQSGQAFRIRGRGCPRLDRGGRGDLLVTVRVVIPRNPDSTLEDVFRTLERLLPDNPRAGLLVTARSGNRHADAAR